MRGKGRKNVAFSAVLLASVLIGFSSTSRAEELSIRDLQSFLEENGYKPGAVDGIDGPRTRAALKAFQSDRELAATGFQDAATQAVISAEIAPSAAVQTPVVSASPDSSKQVRTIQLDSSGTAKQEATEDTLLQGAEVSLPPAPLEIPKASSLPPATEAMQSGDISEPVPTKAAFPKTPIEENSSPSSDGSLAIALLVGILALALFVWLRGRSLKRKRKLADGEYNSMGGQSVRAFVAVPGGKLVSSSPVAAAPFKIKTATDRGVPSANFGKNKASESHFRLANANPAVKVASPDSGTASDRRWFANKGPWIPSGETVKVAGRTLSGMVYVGTPPRTGRYQEKCRAYIDPGLKVSQGSGDVSGTSMPYWPSYSEMSPVARGTYLDWLASGCSNVRYGAGYMFLYFYGLERRFFVDKPGTQEKIEILREVERLQALYHENYSARRYLALFLEAAAPFVEEARPLELAFESESGELPLPVKILLGTAILEQERLSAEQLLSFWYCHPECYSRTPAQRCSEEFRALFGLKFAERYPDGLKLRRPKRNLKVTYRAASSEFEVDLLPKANGQPIPDISGLGTPVTVAKEIADEAMGELDKLSRYLGRNPEARGSLEAHALLPKALWPLFPSTELEEIRLWARGIIENGGLVPLVDLIARMEGSVPDKIGKKQLVNAADALARLGIGFSPDPRFAPRGPKIGDQVMLFEQAEGDLENVSDGYKQALTEITVGAFIAHADNEIAPSERITLQRLIESKRLDSSERARLMANLAWQLSVPPDQQLVRKSLQDASAEESGAIRKAIVAMVHADSVVAADEVSAIEKIYKFLGISEAQVYSDIHALSVSDEPVTLSREQPIEPGEAIPAEASTAFLDSGRIASIRQDTERVSSVLGAIFASDIDDDIDEEAHDDVQQDILPGLDPVHAGFVVELVARERWSETEFNILADQHGLMAAGGLETINEWSFSRFDDALIEEYEGFELNIDIVRQLQLQA